MSFAESGESSNYSAADTAQETQGHDGSGWKSGPARDYPEEWLDPTFKGRSAAEKLNLGFVRAQIDAAKIVAMDNFERDWGTRDVAKVMSALRKAIPGSASPSDAAAKARKALG